MPLNHSEFLNVFYCRSGTPRLLGLKAKEKIAEAIVKHALPIDLEDTLDYNLDTFKKWLNPNRKPDCLSAVRKNFSRSRLSAFFLDNLNPDAAPDIAAAFHIPEYVPYPAPGTGPASGTSPASGTGPAPSSIDPRLVHAIVSQYEAILKGDGIAPDDVAALAYAGSGNPFQTYLAQAMAYRRNSLVLSEEGFSLHDYYVCNDVGDMPFSFSARRDHACPKNERGVFTLEDLLAFQRQQKDPHALLIGSCGLGKSCMMSFLFLTSAESFVLSGLLPVFLEFRLVNLAEMDLREAIFQELCEHDPAYEDRASLDALLRGGKVQLLLDGLDEVEAGAEAKVEKNIISFIKRYPKNRVLISTRECRAMRQLSKDFARLYIYPFDNEMSLKLIDRLLAEEPDPEAKQRVLSYMENGFIKKDGVFATNPMLLTIIVRNQERLASFQEDKTAFYELVYRKMVYEHDEEKEAFTRFYYSVSDHHQFTDVFSELCGMSYLRGVRSFDKKTFQAYLRKLKTVNQLSNSTAFNYQNFLHDACSTACMLYEHDEKIFYVDPGFQEYLFALYYGVNASPDIMKKMGEIIQDRSYHDYHSLEPFQMMARLAGQDRMDLCVFQPFLESIFWNKTNEEAFDAFLRMSFGALRYVIPDPETLDFWRKKRGLSSHALSPNSNEVQNLVMLLLFRQLNLSPVFDLILPEKDLAFPDYATFFLIGVCRMARMAAGGDAAGGDAAGDVKLAMNADDGGAGPSCSVLSLERKPMSLYARRSRPDLMMTDAPPLCGESGEVVSFGFEYELSLEELEEVPSVAELVRQTVRRYAPQIWEAFMSVKKYLTRIRSMKHLDDLVI